MALILCIDTSTEDAFVSLHNGNENLGVIENKVQKEHASFLHPAIETLLKKNQLNLAALQAVAVSSGPGSYTGLRVAMASAKGICYALNIALLCIPTLEILAAAAIAETSDEKLLYYPLIDARRMEVFTAGYSASLQFVEEPRSLVLNADSFSETASENNLCFFGNGAAKWANINPHKNAVFLKNLQVTAAMQRRANAYFEAGNTADLALSDPFYVKSFYDGN